MTINVMSLEDLGQVLDWANAEGWNPGLEDAAAFHAADPEGFFLKTVDGKAAAAISVVNHSDQFAFLGLYICRPEFRAQGHGIEVWKAGLAHAGSRCVGLDGVPDQQENYKKSGFVASGKTVRFRGILPTFDNVSESARPVEDLTTVIEANAQATGVSRLRFAANWFQSNETRQTLVLANSAKPLAFATVRRCHEGFKVGPLHAGDEEQAKAILSAISKTAVGAPVFIDVPDASPKLATLLTGFGFEPVFETARMYLGQPPKTSMPDYYSVASLELG